MKKFAAVLCALSMAFCLSIAFCASALAVDASNTLFIKVVDGQNGYVYEVNDLDYDQGGVLEDAVYAVPTQTPKTPGGYTYLMEGVTEAPASGWYVEFDSGKFIVTVLENNTDVFGYCRSYESEIVFNALGDVVFDAQDQFDASFSCIVACDLTMNGPGSVTIGSSEEPWAYGIQSDGCIVLIDLKLTVFSKYDGIVTFSNINTNCYMQFIRSDVTVSDIGVPDAEHAGFDNLYCYPQSHCGIHAAGDVEFYNSKVDVSSQNQYGVYSTGRLILANTDDSLDFKASSVNKYAVNVSEIVYPSALTLLAGDEEGALTASDPAAVNNAKKFMRVSAKPAAPDPTPKTADSAPVALFAGLMMLGAAGAFIARKRLA